MTIPANSLRWDGAPPTVWVDFNMYDDGHFLAATGEDTPTLHPGDRIVARDVEAHIIRGRVTRVAPAANGGRQVAHFDVIGEPAEVFGDYEGVGMSFKGNYSWSDKVPEWDEVR